MTPSNAKVPCVDVRYATSGDAAVDVVSAETSDATDAQATHMSATNVAHTGTDVTSAKAAHTATKVSSASASATPGLCARGKKAAGKHCTCQNHHRSSSHDILHLIGRDCSVAGPCHTLACSTQWTPTLRYNGDENA
jgi:hypothetical protein